MKVALLALVLYATTLEAKTPPHVDTTVVFICSDLTGADKQKKTGWCGIGTSKKTGEEYEEPTEYRCTFYISILLGCFSSEMRLSRQRALQKLTHTPSLISLLNCAVVNATMGHYEDLKTKKKKTGYNCVGTETTNNYCCDYKYDDVSFFFFVPCLFVSAFCTYLNRTEIYHSFW
jgi:hypothetical protein